MKQTITALAFLLFCISSFAQVKDLYPKHTSPLPKMDLTRLPVLFEQMNKEKPDPKYASELKKLEDNIEKNEVFYQFYSPGCSWYCGGIIDTVKASSFLKQQGKFEYIGQNAHDFDVLSAWVEGVKGNGVGEYLTYFFPGVCPRVTTIRILNGYVKTQKAWQENGRVKTLKLYCNGKPYAVLHLKDTRDLQDFELGDALGAHDENAPQWTLKFEILEVYPGTKYEDTAITEIFFDGIDVH